MSLQRKYYHKLLPIVPDARLQKGASTTLTLRKNKSICAVDIGSVANITHSSQKVVANGDAQIFLLKV